MATRFLSLAEVLDLFSRVLLVGGVDGYHGDLSATLDPARLWELSIEMSDRMSDELSAHAAEILGRHGYRARVNEVGHVAIALS